MTTGKILRTPRIDARVQHPAQSFVASLLHRHIVASSRSGWFLLRESSSYSGAPAGVLLEANRVVGSEPASRLNYTDVVIGMERAQATSETVSSDSNDSMERFRPRGDLKGTTG